MSFIFKYLLIFLNFYFSGSQADSLSPKTPPHSPLELQSLTTQKETSHPNSNKENQQKGNGNSPNTAQDELAPKEVYMSNFKREFILWN